jgi:integrase
MIGCRPLSRDEFALVMRAFRGRYELRNRALFVLGTTTGFRISELLSLSIRDVWRHGRLSESVRVRRRNVKKKTAGRIIALSPLAKRHLELLLGSLSLQGALVPEEPLFASRKHSAGPQTLDTPQAPKALSRVQAYRILRDAFERCELDIDIPGTHVMRKTFAQEVYIGFGGDIFKTQKALGHENPGSTVAYLSFNEAELTQVISDTWANPEENTENAFERTTAR